MITITETDQRKTVRRAEDREAMNERNRDFGGVLFLLFVVTAITFTFVGYYIAAAEAAVKVTEALK